MDPLQPATPQALDLAEGPRGHLQQPGRSDAVERDGLYWTAKFMSTATAAATASDPHWGLEGGMTPLAAVFAAKWRQQVKAALNLKQN